MTEPFLNVGVSVKTTGNIKMASNYLAISLWLILGNLNHSSHHTLGHSGINNYTNSTYFPRIV